VRRGRLMPRVPAGGGALVADAFREEGIAVELGAAVERVEPGIRVSLSDGRVLQAEALLVATGRRPNAEGLGLEQLGVSIGPRGIETDEHLQAAPGGGAAGDG